MCSCKFVLAKFEFGKRIPNSRFFGSDAAQLRIYECSGDDGASALRDARYLGGGNF